MSSLVYFFGNGKADGTRAMKMELGGKGANLAEMTNLGVPVPPGFTIACRACIDYLNDRTLPDALRVEVAEKLERLEKAAGRRLGDDDDPLLVSVRSGAPVSMPGMMETILNLGLNDRSVVGLARQSGNARFAYDSYRRFIQMYGDVVLGVPIQQFERLLGAKRAAQGVATDAELSEESLRAIVDEYMALVHSSIGTDFPMDPQEQLWGAIEAVWKSWTLKKAVDYRRHNDIPETLGTAVNVVAMVYGNMGDDSGTGVAFTRNPSTGEKRFYGEFLVNAQGEDVVAGIRTPLEIDEMAKRLPGAYEELLETQERLEQHYRDMQDIEFTVERGKLYMLQTRTGKRTAAAAVRIAEEMVEEGLISRSEALRRVEAQQLDQLLHPIIDPSVDAKPVAVGLPASPGAASGRAVFEHASHERELYDLQKDPRQFDNIVDEPRMRHVVALLHPIIDPSVDAKPVAVGLPASPGAASGRAVFDPDIAEQRAAEGERVILVRAETTPEDFHGIVAARAVLTARGGMTSHAAVVARGMGKCAVVGCKDIDVDAEQRRFSVNGTRVSEGDWITLDGATGRVYVGELPTVPSEVVRVLSGNMRGSDSRIYLSFARLLGWADEARTLRVRANADTPQDARTARAFGAEGIGLCRTEHMFFEGDRIVAMREMIVAREEDGRRRALAKLLPIQRKDFEGIFEVMDGLPVTVRLLDPPLHEFLPHGADDTRHLAEQLGMPFEDLARTIESLRESNPMLGHRGCRLGITYPEITEMQARAIIEAAIAVKRSGKDVRPEIMVPLVATLKEFENQRAIIDDTARKVMEEAGEQISYTVGTMIELPRAALTADEIATQAEFFSFGTNDLTQTTFGLSRDDAGRFLPSYVERGILPEDPFQVVDVDGVGKLVRYAVTEGRRTRHDLKVGICGEHGGEPRSVHFFHEAGLNYVSCSPYRVPIARLAAARAALATAD